jgi:hypothetical protein
VLATELRGYGPEELLLFEAAVAKAVFIKGNPSADDRENIKAIFKALLKYAQIQTHTAKPGGEDINAWLAAYYKLLTDYEPTLNALADLITSRDAGMKVKMDEFINKNDALVSLALKGEKPEQDEIAAALSVKPVSIYGRLLTKILNIE